MSPQNVKSELELLKAEIERMSARVEELDTEAEAGAPSAALLQQAESLVKQIDWEKIRQELAGALRELGQDVQASRPKALVAAFVAGFLAGRASK